MCLNRLIEIMYAMFGGSHNQIGHGTHVYYFFWDFRPAAHILSLQECRTNVKYEIKGQVIPWIEMSTTNRVIDFVGISTPYAYLKNAWLTLKTLAIP